MVVVSAVKKIGDKCYEMYSNHKQFSSLKVASKSGDTFILYVVFIFWTYEKTIVLSIDYSIHTVLICREYLNGNGNGLSNGHHHHTHDDIGAMKRERDFARRPRPVPQIVWREMERPPSLEGSAPFSTLYSIDPISSLASIIPHYGSSFFPSSQIKDHPLPLHSNEILPFFDAIRSQVHFVFQPPYLLLVPFPPPSPFLPNLISGRYSTREHCRVYYCIVQVSQTAMNSFVLSMQSIDRIPLRPLIIIPYL